MDNALLPCSQPPLHRLCSSSIHHQALTQVSSSAFTCAAVAVCFSSAAFGGLLLRCLLRLRKDCCYSCSLRWLILQCVWKIGLRRVRHASVRFASVRSQTTGNIGKNRSEGCPRCHIQKIQQNNATLALHTLLAVNNYHSMCQLSRY